MRDNKGRSLIALPEDYIVIDTETTGLDYEYCNLIEVSAVHYSGGVRQESFSSLIQPAIIHSYDADTDTWKEEYVDAFIGADEENYCELLLLAGSDYNIVVFMPLILLEQYPQFNAMNE